MKHLCDTIGEQITTVTLKQNLTLETFRTDSVVAVSWDSSKQTYGQKILQTSDLITSCAANTSHKPS